MLSARPRSKIDADASTEEHLKDIRARSQQYIAQAVSQNLPAATRQRILLASLRHLEERARANLQSSSRPSAPASSSQAFSQPSSQGANANSRDAAFQGHLSALIDAEIPPHTLIGACAKAADFQLLPILSKCLAVLASVGHIRDLKTVDGQLIVSQSQYLDHELEPSPRAERKKEAEEADEAEVGEGLPQSSENAAASKLAIRRTGQNFVDEFISKLVKGPSQQAFTQSRSSDVFVASVAREAPLSDHATEQVLQLLINRMCTVDIVELPAFIYQLLLFASSKGKPVVKSQVLLHIAEVFAQHEVKIAKSEEISQSLLADDEDAILASTTSLKQLREVQGTALLHIEFAVSQDLSLAIEVMKLLKSGVENPKHFLSPLGAGIVLLLARSVTIQSDVLGLFREAIVRFDKERMRRETNLFSARVTMNDGPLLNPQQSLSMIANSTCQQGWDFIKESLLELSLVLLDRPLLPSQQDSDDDSLAGALLVKLFESHPSMRSSVLEQLLFRIALVEKSVSQAIAIIGRLSRLFPYYMMEHHEHIRDCIDLMPTLPPWLAYSLMSAFKPFFSLRQDLHDYFQLVIRKSLFNCKSSARAVAICGFLTSVSLPKIVAGTNVLSQLPSQLGPSQNDAEPMVNAISELVQPLRRVFLYPASLRAFMYKNIIDVLRNIKSKQKAEETSISLGALLLNHARRFTDMQRPPYLLVDLCVNETSGGVLVEPLGDLIWCLAVIELTRAPDQYHRTHIIDLAKKLASVSLQDFSVTKGPLIGENDSVGVNGETQSDRNIPVANRNKVRVIGAVIEALIHATLIIPKPRLKRDHVSNILGPLLILKWKIFDLLRDAGASSSSETLRDLGGALDLEPLRPGARFTFYRSSKGGRATKKSASKKAKPSDQVGPSSAVRYGTAQPLGCFSILTSAHLKPSLPLQSCLQVLQLMEEVVSEEAEGNNNPFIGQASNQDFQHLRVYLLALAQKHVDEFVLSSVTKMKREGNKRHAKGELEMFSAVETLVSMAMGDFKRFRRASDDAGGQGGLRSLQIAESCVGALDVLNYGDGSMVASFCKAMLPKADRDNAIQEHAEITEATCDALEKLVENLLGDELGKEVVVVLRIYEQLVKCVQSISATIEEQAAFLERRSQWGVSVVSSQSIEEPGIVRILFQICLKYSENNNDLRRGDEICVRLLEVIGDCDAGAEPPEVVGRSQRKLTGAVAVTKEAFLPIVDVICESVERALLDVEWCLGRMLSLESVLDLQLDSVKAEGSGEKEVEDKLAKHAIRAEDAALTRLDGAMRVVRGMCRCAIGKWTQQERILRLATKCYKLLFIATQSQVKRKGDPRLSFTAMVEESKILSPVLWTFLSFVGQESKDTTGKALNKVAKEARIMPQLVYEVERFEKVLIAAQKKTKINLLRGFRRQTARDFRIREDLLPVDEDEPGAEAGNDDAEAAENENGEDGDATGQESRDGITRGRGRKRRRP